MMKAVTIGLMRRGFLVIAMLVSSLALADSAAAAATPTDNTHGAGSDSFVTTNTCADPIRVDSVWSVVMHTHYDAAGNQTRVQFTGTTRITYTDLANGNTYAPNSSGPGTIDEFTRDIIVRGSNGAVFNSDGVLVATSGRIVYDPDGNIVSIVGHERPVCAALGTTQL